MAISLGQSLILKAFYYIVHSHCNTWKYRSLGKSSSISREIWQKASR